MGNREKRYWESPKKVPPKNKCDCSDLFARPFDAANLLSLAELSVILGQF
jgi:hypothetical protein